MTNQEKTKVHSEQWFGEYRDFWWNSDFVALMAKRWELQNVKSVLDVGCGIGHWGRVLSPFLHEDAKIVGVDREPSSIAKAQELAPTQHCTYQVASAEKLPFESNSFDMVTCQTVLIHVENVATVIAEMLRVLKPGGLLAVAEPNNAASNLILSSHNFFDSVEEKIRRTQFGLMCELGKYKLGLGHNSIGDLLPQYFKDAGLSQFNICISDKALPLVPPYETKEQKAMVNQWIEWSEKNFFAWDYEETKKYFIAGGGTESAFEEEWKRLELSSKRFVEHLKNKSVSYAGAGIFYLASGRKKEPASSAISAD